MSRQILLPSLSAGMEEAMLVRWLKKEGDRVKDGDIIAEIETDKATMEFAATGNGVIGSILVPPVAGGQGRSADRSSLRRWRIACRRRWHAWRPPHRPLPLNPSIRASEWRPLLGRISQARADECRLRRSLDDWRSARASIYRVSKGRGLAGRIIRVDVERALAARPSPSTPAPEVADSADRRLP